MRLLINTVFFVAFALVVHLAMAAIRMSDAGATSAGDGGEAVMSVEASSASIAAMVESWEAPPEIADVVIEAPEPPAMTAPETPSLMAPTALADLPNRPELPAVLPQAPQQPERAFEAPAPPEPPKPVEEPVAEPEPQPEPEPEVEPEVEPAPEVAEVDPAPQPNPDVRPKERPERAKPAPAPPKPASSAVSSVSARAERAAGQGGGHNAGEASASAPSTLSKSRAKSLQAQWGASIRARIDRRKRAPRGSGTGVVVLAVTVAPSGQLLGVSIRKGSGQAALDQAALQAVKAAGRFAKAPKGLGQPRYTFSLPIRFTG